MEGATPAAEAGQRAVDDAPAAGFFAVNVQDWCMMADRPDGTHLCYHVPARISLDVNGVMVKELHLERIRQSIHDRFERLPRTAENLAKLTAIVEELEGSVL